MFPLNVFAAAANAYVLRMLQSCIHDVIQSDIVIACHLSILLQCVGIVTGLAAHRSMSASTES